MLSLQNVSKTYELGGQNAVPAVRDVTLEVRQGEFVIVVGRSGSGKTTLLNLAAGITQPDSGKVMFEGGDLWQLSDGERCDLRNKAVGFVFQFPSLLPTLNVLDNVILPTRLRLGSLQNGAKARAVELLKQVGLSDKLAALPRQLSAGQQQRVVIARALINEPRIVFADEPSSNLDERTEREIMAEFSRLHEELGLTIVMVTHTVDLWSYGTRTVEMAEGRLLGEREFAERVVAGALNQAERGANQP